MALQVKIKRKINKTELQTSPDNLARLQNTTKSQTMRFTNPLERFKAHPTRKHAIHANCYQCMGNGEDSTWKTDIGNCGIQECALWKFRPYQNRFHE